MMAKDAPPPIEPPNPIEPLDFQRQHGVIVDAAMSAGGRMRIVQPPIDRYQARKTITPRQHRSAVRLGDDYRLGILGARDPELRTSGAVSGGMAEAQLIAAEAYRHAIEAIGKRLSSIVIAVCCLEHTVEHVAETRELDARQLMGVFKIGLDHLGDFYGEDPEVVEEIIKQQAVTTLVRGKPTESERMIVLVYRHEADASVRGLQLGNALWDETAQTIGDLRRRALKHLA